MDRYKNLIISYVKTLKKEDIKSFASKYNVFLKDYEVDNIYFEAKNNLDSWFKDIKGSLEKIKDKLEPTTYLMFENLYNKYKDQL